MDRIYSGESSWQIIHLDTRRPRTRKGRDDVQRSGRQGIDKHLVPPRPNLKERRLPVLPVDVIDWG